MQPRPDNTLVKRGANLLLQGAALTDLSCPNCSSPLFRLKDGILWCAKDEKKVVVVKEGEEAPKQPAAATTAYEEIGIVTAATTNVDAGAQTVDLRFHMSVAVAGDIWNIHSVVIEKIL